MIVRKPTNGIYVGTVKIGDYAPVSIQSMITTDPVHTEKAIAEINHLAEAGCELVRVAVPTMASAKALKAVRAGISIPLIADIHFDYRLALEAIENNVDGLRINPGNIGGEDKVLAVIEMAKPKQSQFALVLMQALYQSIFSMLMEDILQRMVWLKQL